MKKRLSLLTSHFSLSAAAAAAVLSLAAGCISPSSTAPTTVERRTWTEMSPDGAELLTQHFDIRTTVRDTVLRDALPDFMETSFAAYARLLPPSKAALQLLAGDEPLHP